GLHDGHQTLGLDRAGIDADHAQPVVPGGAPQRLGEGHERSIAGRTGDVGAVHLLTGDAEYVDDNAAAARLHLGVEPSAHVDVAEDFQVPRGAPAIFGDLLQVA